MGAVRQKLSRNERRKLETRSKLVSAARRVMAERGVAAATIKDITDEADVGFGSFYNYFESKEAIVAAALEEILTGFGEAIDAFNASEDDPLEMMAAGIGNFVRMVRVDPVVSEFLVNVGTIDGNVGENIQSRMLRDLKLGCDRGLFNVPDLRAAGALVSGALLGFMRERLSGRLADSSDAAAVHLVLRMLGAEEAEARRLSTAFKMIPLMEEEGSR